jgi:predicted ATP-dependent endonuclease of OLD family
VKPRRPSTGRRQSVVAALTARRILFVEGQGDAIVCETNAELLDIPLDRLGAAIVELDSGNSFPPAHALIGGPKFGLPCIGMVDEDKQDLWAEAAAGVRIWRARRIATGSCDRARGGLRPCIIGQE